MFSTPQHPAVVLIVDDDSLTLMGTAATLNLAGYECHVARDADAARKAAAGLDLDLIICDVMIDGESGLELCRELKGLNPANADTPFLFVSSNQAPDIIRRSHDAGGAYYLRKPFDPEVLVEIVSKALWMPHLVQTRLQRIEPAKPIRPIGLGRTRVESGIADLM